MTIKKQDTNLFEIKDYKFGEFQKSEEGIRDFNFQNIEVGTIKKREERVDNVRPDFEFNNANEKGFEVEELVSKFRRHDDYKKKRIESEVNEKVQLIREEYREKAFEEGYAAGKKIAQEEFNEKMLSSFVSFESNLKEFFNVIELQKENIFQEYKEGLLKAASSITKWLVLKESEYEPYIERALIHLLKELDSFRSLSISFDQHHYDKYHGILEKVSKSIPELKDYKVKPDLHFRYKGVKVENDKTILECSVEKQMEKIDIIFKRIASDELA